jgi:hypothetical protein
VTCRLRPDKELPEALLLGPHWGDDLGGAHPRRDDLRGARSRRPIILRSASGEREAGRGSGKRGWREREERGAAVVHAEGEPREEDERDEDPAERPHQLLGMPELVRRGGGPDLVGAWTPERITFFSERGRGLLGEEGDRKRDMRGGFPEAEIVCRQPVPFAPAVTSSVSSVSDSTANSSRASPLLPELDAWTSALNRWQGDDRRRLEKVVAVEIL